MGPARLGDGDEFYVLRLNVNREGRAVPGAVPGPSTGPRPVNVGEAPTRIIALSAETGAGGMRWLINGLTYDIGEYPVVVRRGATEVWEYRNDKKSMPHPMHVHGFGQRVLERRDSPEQVRRLAVDEAGRIPTDLGRKDTVTVWPGETVRVAINFSHDHVGEQTYLFHCHVLEHEDQGMMLNFKVVPAEN
jgi:blue copper oxidase